MARKPTCPYCEKEIDKDVPFKKYQNRKYHLNCYKKAMSEKYEDNQSNVEPRDQLYEYICETYGVDEVTPMIKAQIEKYMTDNPDWKYTGILYTIKYMAEIEGVVFKNNPKIKGVGYLPYNYNKAKSHFTMISQTHRELNEQLEHRSTEDFVKKKTVKVTKRDYTLDRKIDIGKL